MNLVMLTRLYLLPRLVLYNSGLFVALLSQPVLDQIFRVSAVLFFFKCCVCMWQTCGASLYLRSLPHSMTCLSLRRWL